MPEIRATLLDTGCGQETRLITSVKQLSAHNWRSRIGASPLLGIQKDAFHGDRPAFGAPGGALSLLGNICSGHRTDRGVQRRGLLAFRRELGGRPGANRRSQRKETQSQRATSRPGVGDSTRVHLAYHTPRSNASAGRTAGAHDRAVHGVAGLTVDNGHYQRVGGSLETAPLAPTVLSMAVPVPSLPSPTSTSSPRRSAQFLAFFSIRPCSPNRRCGRLRGLGGRNAAPAFSIRSLVSARSAANWHRPAWSNSSSRHRRTGPTPHFGLPVEVPPPGAARPAWAPPGRERGFDGAGQAPTNPAWLHDRHATRHENSASSLESVTPAPYRRRRK